MSVQEPWLAKVEKIAEDVCTREGCFLYDLEFSGTGGGRTLRVFVDKDGGSSIDDCSNVSKGLNAVLDEDEALIPGGPYNLEVSTPGVDRQLRRPWHFEKAVGKKIHVRTNAPLGTLGVTSPKLQGTKTVEEVLAGADAEGLTFESAEGAVRIPLGAVEKAKVVFEIKMAQDKPGPKHHPKKKR